MTYRLLQRAIPLFWSSEELGALRPKLEQWYSQGVPISSIIRRAMPERNRVGRRPLSYADVYAALLDAVRHNKIVQREREKDSEEMAIETFRVFFAAWREGGSLKECGQAIAEPIINEQNPNQPVIPRFTNKEAIARMFRSLGERWRDEVRGNRAGRLPPVPAKKVSASSTAASNLLPPPTQPKSSAEEAAKELSVQIQAFTYQIILAYLQRIEAANRGSEIAKPTIPAAALDSMASAPLTDDEPPTFSPPEKTQGVAPLKPLLSESGPPPAEVFLPQPPSEFDTPDMPDIKDDALPTAETAEEGFDLSLEGLATDEQTEQLEPEYKPERILTQRVREPRLPPDPPVRSPALAGMPETAASPFDE